jgi:hypothetical protein
MRGRVRCGANLLVARPRVTKCNRVCGLAVRSEAQIRAPVHSARLLGKGPKGSGLPPRRTLIFSDRLRLRSTGLPVGRNCTRPGWRRCHTIRVSAAAGGRLESGSAVSRKPTSGDKNLTAHQLPVPRSRRCHRLQRSTAVASPLNAPVSMPQKATKTIPILGTTDNILGRGDLGSAS